VDCIAPFETFVEIELKEIMNNTHLDMQPFQRDTTFTFFNLNDIRRDQTSWKTPSEVRLTLSKEASLGPSRRSTCTPYRRSKPPFRLTQTGKHTGKMAFTVDDDDVVPVVRGGSEELLLSRDRDASYVLVGGLGGLGRSISTMLADHGARKICFLSRSGAESAEAQNLIGNLKRHDVI
jgi:zearalenone synthase (highly reducing iterative type I polyketide synthase)